LNFECRIVGPVTVGNSLPFNIQHLAFKIDYRWWL